MNFEHPERIALDLLKATAKLLVLLVALPVVILLLFEGVTLVLTDKIPALFRKLSSNCCRIYPIPGVLKALVSKK
jgi:hypothetical protein